MLRAKTAKTRRGATRRVKFQKSRSRTAKTPRLAPSTTKAVKAIVAKAIGRASETKFVSSYAADNTPNAYTSFNSVITGGGQWGSALPALSQGDTAYNRQGNTIVPRQCKLLLDYRLTTAIQPYPVDITCVIYYGYCKKYRNYADVQANSASLSTSLLRLGGVNAAGQETQPFGGIASDSHLVINNTDWHLQKKTFRLWKAPGALNGTATTPGPTFSCPNKNQHSVMLDFGKMMPSTLKYDTSSDLRPSDWAPVWSTGYYYNDGTPADVSAGTGIVEYKANRMLTFKDM